MSTSLRRPSRRDLLFSVQLSGPSPLSLLRQYFPKGTDLARWEARELAAVAAALNERPRKVLSWRTPAEAFAEHLQSLAQAGVASTS